VRIRRASAALALAAAVIVPTATTATAAYAKHGSSDAPAAHQPAKVAFTATGTITAVDTAAGTVTVAAKGGTRDVRGKTVTIAVTATTRIRLNSKNKSLAALAAGDKISAVGFDRSAVYTATKIEATIVPVKHSPTPAVSTPAPSASPSDDDSPEPADDSPSS
jgi:hypothetical protein